MIAGSRKLDGRVCLITGAAQGIGRAFASHLIKEGAAVVVADINADAIDAVANDLGHDALAIAADVSVEADVRAMYAAALQTFGRIDVVVNNAAIFSTLIRKPTEELSVDEWDRVMAVNVRGAFLCCREAIPTMKAQRSGKLITISSGTVFLGRRGYPHYVTSKAALLGLTRALATELGEFGITANALVPGGVRTEISREAFNAQDEELLVGAQAIRRVQTPADLLGTMTFLASADSDFMTGQVITVDGGLVYY
jgi:3-oxoacyl-[acyl-carrier protein] reductase